MSTKSFIGGANCIVLVTVFFLAGFINAQVREEWITRYNGTGCSPNDTAVAGAVDNLGNMYVTGKSPGPGSGIDYATVKYSPDGSELWIRRYNGPGNLDDAPVAIGIDASNNVYVFGISHGGAPTEEDYLLLKYDPSGNLMWERRYDGPGDESYSPDDSPIAMVVDAAGNVLVTGYSTGAGSEYDYATLKYDSYGNLLWTARYNGPWGVTDYAAALTVDGSSNVCVTGKTPGGGSGYDIATVKYDPNGNLLWAKQYNGPKSLTDEPKLIDVDGLGNIYVTGTSADTGYVRLKYNSAGNLMWDRFFVLPEYFSAEDVAIDDTSNVYIGGMGYVDFVMTLKYDSLGNLLWERQSGSSSGNAFDRIAVDSHGNILVAGMSQSPTPEVLPGFWVNKYDPNGNSTWGLNYGVRCNDIVIDSGGNAFVIGITAYPFGPSMKCFSITILARQKSILMATSSGFHNITDPV